MNTNLRRPCTTVNPELFHAPAGERVDSPSALTRIAAARNVCLDCPVMVACRDYAREHQEWGIWGGETDEERFAAGFGSTKEFERRHSAERNAANKGRVFGRERQVAAAPADGLSNDQIAVELGITRKALQTSLSRLRKALGVPTERIVERALERGVIPLEQISA